MASPSSSHSKSQSQSQKNNGVSNQKSPNPEKEKSVVVVISSPSMEIKIKASNDWHVTSFARRRGGSCKSKQSLYVIKKPVKVAKHKPHADSKAAALDIKRDVLLYKAVLSGDWDSAQKRFLEDEDLITAKITINLETPLHLAVGTGKTVNFVKKLVEKLQPQALVLQDKYGYTALHFAAQVGNTRAAIILVKKNPSLLYIHNGNGVYPVHIAASFAHRDTLCYLLSVTKDNEKSNPFAKQPGAELLINIINSAFLDVALYLVKRYPDLVNSETAWGGSPLFLIARKASAFPSGSRLNFFQRFIYSLISVPSCSPLPHLHPENLENYGNNPNESDVENPAASSQVCLKTHSGLVFHKLQVLFWKGRERLVSPCIKRLREKKIMHHHALQLVEFICDKIRSLKEEQFNEYESLYYKATIEAAGSGVHEFVEKIVDAYPDAIWSQHADFCFIFHATVVNRCENVFNLIHQMSEHRQRLTYFFDKSQNNILHLAGHLAPPHKLLG